MLDEAVERWANEFGNPDHAPKLIAFGLIANQTLLDDQVLDQLDGGVNTSDPAERDLFYATLGAPAFNDTLVDSAAESEQVELTQPPMPASELFSSPPALIGNADSDAPRKAMQNPRQNQMRHLSRWNGSIGVGCDVLRKLRCLPI